MIAMHSGAAYANILRPTGIIRLKAGGIWRNSPNPLKALDARWFQIIFLASFLALGALARDFALTRPQVLLTFTTALATQAAWQWGLDLPGKKKWGGYLSAFISSFGICILVRAENAWVHPFLAALAMSSKYVIRGGPGNSKSHLKSRRNWRPGCWRLPTSRQLR